jgi:glycosyltransferase involved in cell wall biosynthesis/GT2 family glycosyltransferase
VGSTAVDALRLGIASLERVGHPPRSLAGLPHLDAARCLLLVHAVGERTEHLVAWCRAVRELAGRGDVEIVVVLSADPGVRAAAAEVLDGLPRVHRLDAVEYSGLLWLVSRSHVVVTGSADVEEVATSLGKPVLVLRDRAARPEGVTAGVTVLVGTAGPDRLVEEAHAVLDHADRYARMARGAGLYGDGRASERICDRLGLPRRAVAPAADWCPDAVAASTPVEHAAGTPEARIAELEAIVARQDARLRMIAASRGGRILERYWGLRYTLSPGALAARGRWHLQVVRERIARLGSKLSSPRVYSPYDRLTYLKPIPVDVYDDARLARAERLPPVRFTLVATCLQERASVDEWLASVEAQTARPDEIVVADGGSSDGTPEALLAHAARPGAVPLRVLRTDRRLNIAEGRNAAVAAARNEVVVCADFGSRLDPEYCRRITLPFRDPDVDLAMGMYGALGTAPALRDAQFIPAVDSIDPSTFLPSARAIAFRRSVWERCGGYPEWLTLTGEDTLFDLNARKVSRRWAFVPGARVLWRAPASHREIIALARRYGEGDGEAGLEGLWDAYRNNRALRRAMHPAAAPLVLAYTAWCAVHGQLPALRAQLARFRGYTAGQRRRIELLRERRGIRGSALVLSGVPLYDSGGGQRGTQLALELIRRGYETTFVNVYPSFEPPAPVYVETEFELLGLASLADFDVDRWAEARSGTLGRTVAVLEFPHPRFLRVARRLRELGVRVVYDCIDDWATSLGWTWYSERAERRIAATADVLTASARSLRARVERLTGRPVHYLPQGVHASAFCAGAALPRPADLPPGDGPLLLYVGALWGSWFDWDLVRAAAAALPQARFVFVGKYDGECPAPASNMHFVGLKPHRELPAYLAAADVCTIPFHVDEVTRAVNPLKVYEYLAMGKPVVATELPELEGMPYVLRSSGPAAFVENLRRALELRVDPARIAAFVAESSWGRRVEDLLAWCGLEGTSRAAGEPLEPAPPDARRSASG